MNKKSIIALQQLDCNCNDCKFLIRNLAKQELQNQFHAKLQKQEFDRNRNNVLALAFTYKDNTAVNVEFKKTFKPKKPNAGYGYCKKFDFKEISFIPNILQLDTQHCFEHRNIAT